MGDVENRRNQNMQCSIQESGDKKEKTGEAGQLSLRILLRFEDKMNRQLSCLIDNQMDSPVKLAEELVQHGFIHPLDSGAIQEMLDAAITKTVVRPLTTYHSSVMGPCSRTR